VVVAVCLAIFEPWRALRYLPYEPRVFTWEENPVFTD